MNSRRKLCEYRICTATISGGLIAHAASTASNELRLLPFSLSSPAVVASCAELRCDSREAVAAERRREVKFPIFFAQARRVEQAHAHKIYTGHKKFAPAMKSKDINKILQLPHKKNTNDNILFHSIWPSCSCM